MIEDRAADLLRRHEIIWLTTVRPNGQPQSFPVWFVLEGEEIRIWSVDGVRVENLSTNPKVSLHLSDNGRGDDTVTIEGQATIDRSARPASANKAYVDHYQSLMNSNEWTWEYFDSKYSVPIRIRPTRVRAW